MTTDEAAKIVRSLAEGCDPQTGERLDPQGIFERGDIGLALVSAFAALVQVRMVEERRARQKPNSGKRWSREEDEKLIDAFEKGTSVKLLAAEHQRSVYAIHARLVKCGKIQPGDTVDGVIVQQPRYDGLRM